MRKINFPLEKDAKSNKQMNLRKCLHVSALLLVGKIATKSRLDNKSFYGNFLYKLHLAILKKTLTLTSNGTSFANEIFDIAM